MDTRPSKRMRYDPFDGVDAGTCVAAGEATTMGLSTTTSTTPTIWAHLPDETWDLVLNGTDRHGRAFLDWRWRVAVRATCRRLRDVVSAPCAVDRSRLAGRAGPLGKRAIGAAVCVSVAARLLASAPHDATLDDLVALLRATYLARVKPTDPWVLAAAALTGNHHHADAVAAVLARLSTTSPSPSPKQKGGTISGTHDDDDDDDVNDYVDDRIRDDDDNGDPMEIDRYDRVHTDAAAAATLVYRVCVAHDCASGADAAAPFLSLDDLLEPAHEAVRADDVDAVLGAVRHAKRAALLGNTRERHAQAMHSDTIDDRINEYVWTAVLSYGTPSVAVGLVGEVYQDSLALKVHRLARFGPLRVCSVSHSGAASFDAGERWSARPHAMADAVRLMRRAIADGDVLVAAWVVTCYEDHWYHTVHDDPPFGPLPVDEVVRLAMRAGTYALMSPWLVEWTDVRPGAEAVASALVGATVRAASPTTAVDVATLAADWTREVADAHGGQALVAYLARWGDGEVARGPARQAMPPSSGPIVRGLWAYHAHAVRRAWEADDMTRMCNCLLGLCTGARQWGLVNSTALDGARVRASGTRDEWTLALERLSALASDAELWAPWRGAVRPLAQAGAIREAALWWADSDERSIVLGTLDLLDRALDDPCGSANVFARPSGVPFL
ncbi:hypothetical protein psal_cds_682 [Pandoravirus salinus]|uniref:F-box incomplete domain containing protein n=1 Tax=Pandoravirus salinus TaxID=1349410 RepID=S4VVG8_9VIRU|nr:hypothetical protein psal_cds_682 [Pandoravirus salinus]AGO84619.1 hypothetical protein psal_cds_682 [Pandoravirus salinus]